GQVAAKGDLRPGEDQCLPPLVLPVIFQEFLEPLHRLRFEPVHGSFDHAVLTEQVAPEVHRDLDVLIVVETPHGGLASRSRLNRSDLGPRGGHWRAGIARSGTKRPPTARAPSNVVAFRAQFTIGEREAVALYASASEFESPDLTPEGVPPKAADFSCFLPGKNFFFTIFLPQRQHCGDLLRSNHHGLSSSSLQPRGRLP